MEIEGVRFFAIRDAKDGLIDLRVFFTVKQGNSVALYAFDKKSSKKQQSRANDVIEKARQLARMKEKVEILGTDASAPHSQRVTATLTGIVPGEEGRARILIGKVQAAKSGSIGNSQKAQFSVRLTVIHKKAEDNIALEIPFDGDPGALKDTTHSGEAAFLTDGRADVAKVTLELYNIPGS